MKNNQKIKAMIGSFSGQNNIISFPKVYLILTEDINAALLLNQIVYWSDRSRRKDGYFYKSYKEWNEEIMLSQYQVKRAATKLEQLGFITTKRKKANNAPTVHYKAHIEEITNSIMKKLDNQETQQSDYEETSFSDYEETQQSSITDDYLTDDYTVNYPKRESDPVKEDFETWWNLYDKKVEKKKAFTRFKVCHKKDGFDKIMDGTRSYLKTVDTKQYQKNPTTFLNGDIYLDKEGFDELAREKVNQFKPGNQPNAYNENADLIEERRKQREADMLSDHMPFG